MKAPSPASVRGFKGAPPPCRELFVSRVILETEVEDIENLMKSEGNDDIKLTMLSNERARFKSFKMNLPLPDFCKVFQDSFPWPEGVAVCKFVPRTQLKQRASKEDMQLMPSLNAQGGGTET